MDKNPSEYAERVIVRINTRLSAEITCGDGGFTVEWMPRMPKKLSAAEIGIYKDARNKLIASYSLRTGKKMMVVDI